MKILDKGAGYKRESWQGKIVSCRDCGARFQLEPGDKVEHSYDQRDGDAVKVKCPSCQCVNWVDCGGGSQQWDR